MLFLQNRHLHNTFEERKRAAYLPDISLEDDKIINGPFHHVRYFKELRENSPLLRNPQSSEHLKRKITSYCNLEPEFCVSCLTTSISKQFWQQFYFLRIVKRHWSRPHFLQRITSIIYNPLLIPFSSCPPLFDCLCISLHNFLSENSCSLFGRFYHVKDNPDGNDFPKVDTMSFLFLSKSLNDAESRY